MVFSWNTCLVFIVKRVFDMDNLVVNTTAYLTPTSIISDKYYQYNEFSADFVLDCSFLIIFVMHSLTSK